MNNPFFSEIFILALLIICCGRLFFIKYGKSDCLTVLSPICLILSIANIFAWDLDLFSAGTLIISLFSTIINFRALIRFFSGLLVDHYSIAFSINAIIVLLASIAEVFLLIYFAPKTTNLYDYNVKETTIRLSGNFSRGFKTAKELETSSGIIKIYENEDSSINRNQIIMMLPDKRSNFHFYRPYIARLAQAGFKIYMADFFANDIRWFNSIFDNPLFRRAKMDRDYFKNKLRFESEKEFYTYNSMFEYKALLSFIEKNEGIIETEQADENQEFIPLQLSQTPQKTATESESNKIKPIFIISDWMAEDAAKDFIKANPNKIAGLLQLSDFEYYNSPGFGFVQLEKPFLAYKLGLSRTHSTEIPEKMAKETIEKIQIAAPWTAPKQDNQQDNQQKELILEQEENQSESYRTE